jgi:type VI secretion system VasD/TssJ family lipoprotein
LFGLGGGDKPKERTLELTFVASDQLNYDGTSPNVVQVAAYVLTDYENFLGGQARAFFDDDFHQEFSEKFAADTVSRWMFTIRPGETRTYPVRYTYDPARSRLLTLGVIGDFFKPPESGRAQRSIYTLRNKSVERLTITLGENYIRGID